MTGASLEQNMTAARREHLVPGREVHSSAVWSRIRPGWLRRQRAARRALSG